MAAHSGDIVPTESLRPASQQAPATPTEVVLLLVLLLVVVVARIVLHHRPGHLPGAYQLFSSGMWTKVPRVSLRIEVGTGRVTVPALITQAHNAREDEDEGDGEGRKWVVDSDWIIIHTWLVLSYAIWNPNNVANFNRLH